MLLRIQLDPISFVTHVVLTCDASYN